MLILLLSFRLLNESIELWGIMLKIAYCLRLAYLNSCLTTIITVEIYRFSFK